MGFQTLHHSCVLGSAHHFSRAGLWRGNLRAKQARPAPLVALLFQLLVRPYQLLLKSAGDPLLRRLCGLVSTSDGVRSM